MHDLSPIICLFKWILLGLDQICIVYISGWVLKLITSCAYLCRILIKRMCLCVCTQLWNYISRSYKNEHFETNSVYSYKSTAKIWKHVGSMIKIIRNIFSVLSLWRELRTWHTYIISLHPQPCLTQGRVEWITHSHHSRSSGLRLRPDLSETHHSTLFKPWFPNNRWKVLWKYSKRSHKGLSHPRKGP